MGQPSPAAVPPEEGGKHQTRHTGDGQEGDPKSDDLRHVGMRERIDHHSNDHNALQARLDAVLFGRCVKIYAGFARSLKCIRESNARHEHEQGHREQQGNEKRGAL